MEKDNLYFCNECWWYFDLWDWEHIDNIFTCHRCYHMKEYLHIKSVEYISEIAFCIGGNWYKQDMDKILKEYEELDFDYECYVDFYKRILLKAERTNNWTTLLETIYDIVNNKKELLDTRDIFLSIYKK